MVDSGGAVCPFGFAVNSGGLVLLTGEMPIEKMLSREKVRKIEKKKVKKRVDGYKERINFSQFSLYFLSTYHHSCRF